jgi:RNA polymerase sigma-70 factor (sigma-E family)
VDRDDRYAAYVTARRPALVRSAVLLGCSREEAEDVTQTALVRCYTSWHKVVRADNPDAYVYRILVNCLAKSRRRRWWGERATAETPEQDARADPADAAATTAVVRSALQRLSEEQRAVIVLRFFADLSERQVADALRIPVGTVKSRSARGLAQLSTDADLAGLLGDRSM